MRLVLSFLLLSTGCLADPCASPNMKGAFNVHPNCDAYEMDNLWKDTKTLVAAGSKMMEELKNHKPLSEPDEEDATEEEDIQFVKDARRLYHRLRALHYFFGTA